MAVPTTRTDFKAFCLRALGDGAINIDVTDDQVEDRIDEALQYYYDYHYDGTEKVYYKHQVDANTISNGYVDLPENIIGVVKIFEIGNPATSTDELFNIRYQIALNDLHSLSNVHLVDYYMSRQHLGLLEEILVGKTPIRYSRHRNRVHIDKSMSFFNEGEYILFEVYEIIDPDTYPDVWKDWWLQYYTQQLIKRQWGSNLKKFEGMRLPGDVTYSGQQIYDEAQEEIVRLQEEMIDKYSIPVMDMIG